MKTLIISSSLSPNSRSRLLCQNIYTKMTAGGQNIELVDLREYDIQPVYAGVTDDMEMLKGKVAAADSYIFAMGVYNYSVNDSLKIFLDTCMHECVGKFFGVVCAAGGQRSYLSTMHLTQMCMNERRMMQLPRVIYATGEDFAQDEISSPELRERLELFVKEFVDIGERLVR